MKRLEYFYFNIYNYCQQRSYYSSPDSVRLQVMYILSLSAGGWILFLQAAYLRLVLNSWFSSQPGAMLFAVSVYLIIGLAFYHIFIINKRDEKILNKFEHLQLNDSNKKRDLLLSIFVAAVPYVLMLSLKLFFPREH